jgi:hypothetical protein
MSAELHPDLQDWLTDKRPTNGPSFVPKGMRDVMWCPYMNEPMILEYKGDAPTCPGCGDSFEASTHAFICHINKPWYD